MLRVLVPRTRRVTASCGTAKYPTSGVSKKGARYSQIEYAQSEAIQPQFDTELLPHLAGQLGPQLDEFDRLVFDRETFFEAEEQFLLAKLSNNLLSRFEANALQEKVRNLKLRAQKASPKDTEALFYYFASKGQIEDMVVSYYDFKQGGGQLTKSMCQYLMLFAGKGQKKDIALAVLKDLESIKYLKWSKILVLVSLKTFAAVGDVPSLLTVYDKMYEAGILPEKVHWTCMLRGAARAGCPQNFSRFYSRLMRKFPDNPPSLAYLQSLLSEWGMHDDLPWRLSKKCNTQTGDYVHMVRLASLARNFKLAIQIMEKDIFTLNQQPTCQLYEVFLQCLSRQVPRYAVAARNWRIKWTEQHGVLDKQSVADFNAWLQEVKEYLGDSIANVPPPPEIVPPTERQTRKGRAVQFGFVRQRVRYVSQFTDPDKLFEYVPHYLRRLEREKKEKEKQEKLAKATNEIDQEIEAAKKKKSEWRELGFRGNFAMDDTLLHPPKSEEDEALAEIRDQIFEPGYDIFNEEKTKEDSLRILATVDGEAITHLPQGQKELEAQRDIILRVEGIVPSRHPLDPLHTSAPEEIAGRADWEVQQQEWNSAVKGVPIPTAEQQHHAKQFEDENNVEESGLGSATAVRDEDEEFMQESLEELNILFPPEPFGESPTMPGDEDSTYMRIETPRRRHILAKRQKENELKEALKGELIDVEEFIRNNTNPIELPPVVRPDPFGDAEDTLEDLPPSKIFPEDRE